MLRLMDRRDDRKKSPLFPLVVTFVASGIWHGLEEAYIWTFIGWACLEMLARGLKTTIFAYWFNRYLPEIVAKIIVKLTFMQMLFYLTIPFHWIERDVYMRFYAYHNYFWHWFTLALLLITFFSPKGPRTLQKNAKSVTEKQEHNT